MPHQRRFAQPAPVGRAHWAHTPYPRSRGSSMADATAGSSRAVARARPTAARRPRDVRVEMVIVVGQEEEEVAWLRRVGWVVRGRARARNPLPAMQRAGPKRSGDACWPCGVCPGVIGCGLCSVGSKRGSPCECGPRGGLVLVRGAASSGGARGTVGDTGNRSHRAAGRILAPSSPASLPPHHNPQPTTRHTPTHFDAAVGGLGQAVRQQQRHGHGRGCC